MVATGPSSPPAAPTHRRTLAAVVIGAVVAGLIGWLTAPVPSVPGPQSTGDPELAERLRAEAGTGRHGLVAAVVRGGEVTVAGIGGDGDGNPVGAATPFEIGSVTKTFTGAVLADLERRGVVRGDERVRDLVGDPAWRDGGGGDATLAELASHTSGLPNLAPGFGEAMSRFARGFAGFSPYDSTPADIMAAADRADIGATRGEYLYSNLGVALLGQALVARTGTPYEELVRTSVTGPLGMTATTMPDDRPPGAAISHDQRGRAVHAWISDGDRPAGVGVWSTADDLVRYAGALADPSSPVAAAAVPRYDSDLGRIGYGWETLEAEGRTLLWKNGGVGGTWTDVLVEPERQQAVVLWGNSQRPVSGLAVRLLDVPSPFGSGGGSSPDVAGLVQLAVAAVFPVLGGLTVVNSARGGLRGRRPVRRLEFVGAVGTGLFFLAVTFGYSVVSWLVVPSWLIGCALFGAGLGIAAVRRRWDGDDGPGAWARRANAAIGVVLGAGATTLLVIAALTV